MGISRPSDLRPSPATTPYHKKVTSVSFHCDKTRAGRSVRGPGPKWWGGVCKRCARPCNNRILADFLGRAPTSWANSPILGNALVTLCGMVWLRVAVTATHHPPFTGRGPAAISPARCLATICNFGSDFVIKVQTAFLMQGLQGH